jgi:hypothetical protein
MVRWFPQEITQHQKFVNNIFNIYQDSDAVILVDKMFYCFYVRTVRTGAAICLYRAKAYDSWSVVSIDIVRTFVEAVWHSTPSVRYRGMA